MKKRRRHVGILTIAILCLFCISTVFSFANNSNGSAIKIISQPQSVSVGFGEHPILEVQAENVAEYQWEELGSEGRFQPFNSNYSSSFEATHRFTHATDWSVMEDYGKEGKGVYHLRCRLTGVDGSVVYTDEITVTEAKPEWGSFQSEVHAKVGDSVTLHVDTSKLGQVIFCEWNHTYWKVANNYTVNSASSEAVRGAKNWRSDTTTFTVRPEHHLMKFYVWVQVPDRYHIVGPDDYITLYVDGGPIITSQPQSSITTNEGDTVKLSVKATNGHTYQWKYYSRSRGRWMNSKADGATTATMQMTPRGYDDGLLYRCVVTSENGAKALSESAQITINGAPRITKQPTHSVTPYNQQGKIRIEATGRNLKYQWQYYDKKHGSWKNSRAKGAKTSTLTYIYPKSEWYNTKTRTIMYRCVVTGPDGSKEISSHVYMRFTPVE